MKLKTKPKQADTADAKADADVDHKAETDADVANSEGDGGAKSKERKTSDGIFCETQVDDRGSSCEGEPEDSSPSKLTEMTVEYEALGVKR